MTFLVKNGIIYSILIRKEDVKINTGINDFLEHDIDFTNYDVVRNVILNKQTIIEVVTYQQRSKFLSFENREFNIELVEYVENIYSKLDKYIEVCNFNNKNTKLIHMLFEGYSIKEIATELKIKNEAIFDRVRRITFKINSVAVKDKRENNEIKIT
ncbi:hypothetical protein [Lactococcus phage P1048]|uniref:Uncharacterized protein n=1 Tax=Lactococcus phage P1048 TaxID=2662295 RepID=A0A649V3R4_9CAUD|nr:hypothetical protein H1Z36_gp080 [Lactococcus phage P1048]QGJ85048.1 hypothetical protein [Lactococcus phage P1048]